MKHVLILTGMALLVSACATGPSAYGPANGSTTGFKNTQIQQDRFRVSYTGQSLEEARDYALLRAAEIAINEGYTHFKVINGYTSDNGRSPVSSNIGIGVGSGGGFRRGRTRTNVNVGVGVYDVARALQGSNVTETIEIILENSGSKDPNVYDAKSVSQSIQPAAFKNTP